MWWLIKWLQNAVLGPASPSAVLPAPGPLTALQLAPPKGCCGRRGRHEGVSGAWAGTTHDRVSLCLPADDCLWGFPTQGLFLPKLLQHLGPAGGQRVPHFLWHPVSRTPSAPYGGTQVEMGVREDDQDSGGHSCMATGVTVTGMGWGP